MIFFVGGPSGTGKTTIATELCKRRNSRFVEGDDQHPEVNIRKMESGIPLCDEDRFPWLEKLTKIANEDASDDFDTVITCSMLKKSYRDFIRERVPSVKLIVLANDYDTILAQMQQRKGHFFQPVMLESQFKDFQAPEKTEASTTVIQCKDKSVQQIVDEIIQST